MSSARFSTDRPVLLRLTLEWFSISLSKGISRDGDRVIFRTVFIIRFTPRRPPEVTLSISWCFLTAVKKHVWEQVVCVGSFQNRHQGV